MSLPNNALSVPVRPAALAVPDDIVRSNPTVDYERGGVGLNDPSEGLTVRNWRARLVSNQVLVGPEPYTAETVVTSAPGITELSLAFDQNMRPAVAYIAAGRAYLYWFDSFVGAAVTTELAADITSVFLTTDDKRSIATQTNSNDIMLFYLRSGMLRFRQQRDRFAIERDLSAVVAPFVRISRVGMGVNNRLQIEVSD